MRHSPEHPHLSPQALLGRALDLSLGCLRAAGGAEPGGPAPARRAALLERSPATLCTLCLAAQRAGAPPTQALVPALESAIAFLAQAGPASVGAPDACRQLAVAATHICAGLPAASLGAPAMALVTACGPGGGLPPAAALASTLALLEAFECRGAGDPATSAPARASSSQALAGWRALARDAGASLPRAELADRLSRCLASCLALAPDLARPELPGLLEWCVGCMARPGEESTHVLLCRALETWGADVTARPLLLRAVLDVLGRGVAGSDAATVAARQTTLLCALRTLRSDRVAQAELAPRAAEAATAGMSSQNPTLARNALKLLAELLLPLGIEGSSAPGLLRSLAPTVVCALFVAFASPVLAWPLPQVPGGYVLEGDKECGAGRRAILVWTTTILTLLRASSLSSRESPTISCPPFLSHGPPSLTHLPKQTPLNTRPTHDTAGKAHGRRRAAGGAVRAGRGAAGRRGRARNRPPGRLERAGGAPIARPRHAGRARGRRAAGRLGVGPSGERGPLSRRGHAGPGGASSHEPGAGNTRPPAHRRRRGGGNACCDRGVTGTGNLDRCSAAWWNGCHTLYACLCD